jgi:DNA-binding NarL/FixJ family response regulator
MGFSTASPPTLLVIDDHPVFPDALARALAAWPDTRILAKADDGQAAVQAWRRHRPAVTLLDLRKFGKAGLRTLRQIRAIDSTACVVVMATTDRHKELDEAAKAGAAFCIARSLGYDGLVPIVRLLYAECRAISPAQCVAGACELGFPRR